MSQAPIVAYITQAKRLFQAENGFPAEKLHASRLFESALQRWAKSTNLFKTPTYEGAEILGLEILQSTKKHSPHVEFWLSATRDTQVFSIHIRLEPEEVGQKRVVIPGEVQMFTDDASYDESQS